ncbi:MAG: hydantoinase B/oxoprolinase family protein [Nitrososphaerales archaeon]
MTKSFGADVEVTKQALVYISDEMAVMLRKSAFSPNIRERADHSCAVLDPEGRTLGQAEQIPVHIGSLPLGLKNTLRYLQKQGEIIRDGDMYVVNDPYISGTHLNDVTLIGPVFVRDELVGYVANKAHHVDVGGMVPASISPDATELWQEGMIIPPSKIIDREIRQKNLIEIMKSNSRQPDFVEGDLTAQINANRLGRERFSSLVGRIGVGRFERISTSVLDHAEALVKAEYSRMPKGTWTGEDFLELNDELLKIRAEVTFSNGRVYADFRGTAAQVEAPLNAVYGVTVAAVSYAIKSLVASRPRAPSIPLNDGFNRTVSVVADPGLLVNPTKPAPVAAGNLETSQRIVDVIYRALAEALPDLVPAASHGSMNNLMMGGHNPETGKRWTFYETIGGGSGARPEMDGIDGIQVNMTNTLNTPIEVMEYYYPLRFESYGFRDGSGGQGKWRGGVGIVRSFTATSRIKVTVLGDRSRIPPWGLRGGSDGSTSSYAILRKNGITEKLPSKKTSILEEGDRLTIETAGGGGFGDRKLRTPNELASDEDYGYSR